MGQWYYAHDNQQLGPVEELELKKLLEQGTITSETLIWKDGMGDWKSYEEIFNSKAIQPSPKAEPPATSTEETAAAAAAAVKDVAAAVNAGGKFGAPVAGTKAAELGLKYDFGDIMCWGIAITLIPCIGLFGYIALLVLFILEFIELKKLVDEGKLEESQYSKVHPALLILGLFCCSIIFYPLFMHWRNQTGVFKPQPNAVWFAILILVISILISLLLNGASALLETMG